LSSEHFSVDGTLLEAWASLKSFLPKDGSGDPPGPGGNRERDFCGERRKEWVEQAVTPHLAQNQKRATLGNRQPHDPSSRLCDLAAHPQTH